MKFRFKNGERVASELRSVGERVADGARKVMRSAANRIEKRAKLYTPVDTFRLEESIRQEIHYEGRYGRLAIDIVTGGVIDGVNVDDYASAVHEAYETTVARNGPGPGTLEKMQQNPGVYIGSKFLERAADEEEKKLRPRMIGTINRVIGGHGGAVDENEEFDE